jgi:hypothetical protein
MGDESAGRKTSVIETPAAWQAVEDSANALVDWTLRLGDCLDDAVAAVGGVGDVRFGWPVFFATWPTLAAGLLEDLAAPRGLGATENEILGELSCALEALFTAARVGGSTSGMWARVARLARRARRAVMPAVTWANDLVRWSMGFRRGYYCALEVQAWCLAPEARRRAVPPWSEFLREAAAAGDKMNEVRLEGRPFVGQDVIDMLRELAEVTDGGSLSDEAWREATCLVDEVVSRVEAGSPGGGSNSVCP